MEPFPIVTPCTHDRPESAGPRRSSMEDSDSSLTRKRPRLDSGSHSYRSMSADRVMPSTPAHRSETARNTPLEGTLSAGIISGSDSMPVVEGTPSRVTINVRDPAVLNSPFLSTAPVGQDTINIEGDKDELANSSDAEPSKKLTPPSPHIISPPSSASRSPEIEVAEVEDMNQEPGHTKWRPLSNIQDPVKIKDDLWAVFPCRNRAQSILQTVDEITRHFQQDLIEDGRLFRELASWIRHYLSSTEPYSSEWFDLYADEHKFWSHFIDIMNSLCKRCSTPTISRLPLLLRQNDSGKDREALEDLLVSFAALTFRMIEIDCQTLEKATSDDQTKLELISVGYLEWLHLTLSMGKSALWRNLQTIYDYDAAPTISIMLQEVCRPSFDGTGLLLRLMHNLLHRARNVPYVTEKIAIIFEMLYRVTDHYHLVRRQVFGADNDAPLSRQDLLARLYAFFQASSTMLQSFITKQMAALSHVLCETIVCHLGILLRKITTASEDITTQVLKEDCGFVQTFSAATAPVIAEEAWKFQMFRKCFLEGRMEIRIQGVESMQSELVAIHRKFIQGNSLIRLHPVVPFLCDFIVANKLIDYLLGVESHPRLIRLTGNIVGFLVVSGRYTEAESDRIWETVTKSQDPGVVGAILQMLPCIFNISNFPQLLYLVTKLNDIPMGAWDNRMTVYATDLFHHIMAKWKESRQNFSMDKQPYHCCIRIMREASACESLAFSKRRNISMFASQTLETLLEVGPSDNDRLQIYEDCVGDIAARTVCATGSICVISILLRHDSQWNIGQLAEEFGLADLVIAEFEHTISRMALSLHEPRLFDESLTARLDLLQQIIMYSPNYIGTEQGWSLWNVMVGSKAPNHLARESALVMLVNATMSLRKRNSFIDACISEYLPRLPPRFFTSNMLYFVTQVFHYGNFVEQIDHETASCYSDRLGVDMLWRVALVAPSNTIERKAIETLVTTYLDSPKTQGVPKVAIERMHTEVVERCVRQLTATASQLKAFTEGTSSGEDEPMIVVASDEEMNLHRLTFSRSLLVLKELFQRLRNHPSYSPVPSVLPQEPTDVEEINGNPITIHYQPFSGGSSRSIRTVQVGDLDKVGDLIQRFTTLTGFSRFTVIVGGQKVNLDECNSLTIRATRLHEKGLFLIQSLHGNESLPGLTPARAMKPLEMEIMGHFFDFYRFLSLDENLAEEVLEFLKAFPPGDYVVSLAHSKDSSVEDVFPASLPSKSLYSVYTYEQCLLASFQNGSPNQEFICHGIGMMAKSLTRTPDHNASASTDREHRANSGLIDCLLKFLKETARNHTSSQVLSEHPLLMESLLSNVVATRHIENETLASSLICGSLACILEASLHSEILSKRFRDTNQFQTILRSILLSDPRRAIRAGIARSIRSICDHPGLEASLKHDFAGYCWTNIEPVIPETLKYGNFAEDFCGVATTVLRSLDDTRRQNLDLPAFIESWCGLLLKHHHDEFVGRDSLDWVIHGISDLVQWCIQFIKSTKKPLKISGNLVDLLLRAHLFPPISEPVEEAPLKPAVPVLHSKTRHNIYNILLAMGNDVTGYHRLLKLVRELLPQGEGPQAWSWGIAQTAEDYTFDANWNFERANVIRSSTGYPGLRNLTNTCYMNSLLTQLFMNAKFRRFILGTEVTDGSHSQRLLAETRTLFAFMQESMLKAVDTQGIADALVNYENTLIDVSVQMDVDEFYNLLFDRWESQILLDADKKSFRAFYGGQIVQQIKSKECPHISERLEPFSAIQCDIQGKSNLMESLSAYVGGEVMEGDNKYSCTSCGTYVDAVKRACFKDIPNNLIFHLKRFDYDIMNGNRHKINDKFDFPERIDMAPYSIDFLQDTERPPSPDIFELVGILVHTGTAESGHYYSYIQERAGRAEPGASWVEFNDADVTHFNPAQIPDLCFGGVIEPVGYSASSYPKSWNAYMLFYQRLGTAETNIPRQRSAMGQASVKETLSPHLRNRITIDNERFLRKYCLNDSAHAAFVVSLLDQLRVVTKSCCSDGHTMETDAIILALEYADQVLSRMKDSADFEKLLDSLTTIVRGCSTCCKIALEWVADNKTAFRNLLLRCPASKVRKVFADMLVRALRYLRENDAEEYGFNVNSIELKSGDGMLPESSSGILQRLVRNLQELWPSLQFHLRAWDDYFGLLAAIAECGAPETFLLLREDFLKLCLEVLIVDSPGTRRLRVDNPHYSQLLRLIEKGRRYSLANLTQLLQTLLLRIDLQARTFDPSYHDRVQLDSGLFSLSTIEDNYLHYGTESGRFRPLVFLDKIVSANSNPSAVKKILQTMISAEPRAGHLPNISKTILNGINIDPADLAAPHLIAALTFCETCHSQQAVKDMITQIAHEVDTIGTSGGTAHLDFFLQARQLVNPRIPRRMINRLILRTVSLWAPPLLMYYDETVRQGTVEFLKVLIFQNGNQITENGDDGSELEDCARGLCEACIKRVQDNVIRHQNQVDIRSVEVIRDVIRHCVEKYFQTGTVMDDQVAEEAEAVYDAIQVLSVDETEEACSDVWNNSDGDLPSDSGSENLLASP